MDCDRLGRAYPSCDVLVNNLGIYGLRDFFETPDDEWARYFEVNVMSGVRLSRAYLPGMMERRWGRVIFISSESGLNIPADMIHYGMTKTAMLAISRGLAKRAAGTGVTVNAILPGPTLTDGIVEMLKDQIAATGRPLEEVAAGFVIANPAQFHHPSPRHRGGSGQHGCLCRFASGLGDDGRRAARRWRCRRHDRVIRHMTWRSAAALAACAVLSTSVAAQGDDAAYCAQLAGLALRYTGSAGGEGRLAPDLSTLGAIDDCNKGRFAAGIAVLERKLRNNGFTLPKR